MPAEHAGPASLRKLLDAVLLVGSELDLEVVLLRIIEAAVDLVGARYGALGVLNESGTGLAQFITVGVDDATRAAIGPLPKGLGLLGTLITDARPLRLPDLAEHPNRHGFPPNHPPMTSFLGVPIRLRQAVFGNLYLTDKKAGEAFTDIDEELVLGLAAAAGVAIENARLFAAVSRREAALAAMHQLATALLAGAEPRESLRLVARHARELVNADLATVALPEESTEDLLLAVAEGDDADALRGTRFPRRGSVSGDVFEFGKPQVLDDASTDYRLAQPQVRAGDLGPAVFVALLGDGTPFGTLALFRRVGSAPFDPDDLELINSFAAQAAVALEHDRGRKRVQRIEILEDQERIARDLHDSVIQRLFAIGLSIQATGQRLEDRAVQERLAGVVDELDLTIRHIRTVIFGVEAARGDREVGLRARILDLTRELGPVLGFDARVVFSGVVDTNVGAPIADELLACLREALSNTARHAQATRVVVDVTASSQSVALRVTDNGIGVPPGRNESPDGHGLRNMAARAQRLGGQFDIEAAAGGGTVVHWEVPLTPPG